ncbi:unnamed protein product [Peronospora belbahrii]|uniref:Uncharacterized protein n=1 Tax=Peronospora belbahrii TaxID=622444 RepID=A0ABN8CVP5_9STRA|nr:unnamed protein product [Peronospora belbahrii]
MTIAETTIFRSDEVHRRSRLCEGSPYLGRHIEVVIPPCTAAAILSLSALPWKDFLHTLKAGNIEQVCIVITDESVTEEVLEALPTAAACKEGELAPVLPRESIPRCYYAQAEGKLEPVMFRMTRAAARRAGGPTMRL